MPLMINNSSLYKKILFWFLLVGLFPFFLFYIYTIYWAEDKIVHKLIKEQHYQAKKVVDNIETNLKALNNEVLFLSQVDIMDDIIVDDIDKRIARFLIQKKEESKLDLNFFIFNKDGKIIASTSSKKIEKQLFTKNNHSFILGDKLYIYNKIYASFSSHKELGSLLLEYSLANLQQMFTKEEGVYTSVYNPKKNIIVGSKIPFKIELKEKRRDFILPKYLVTITKMPYLLDGWYFIYYKNKRVALSFLYDFLYFMLAMVPVVLILVVIIGVFSAKSIIKPIEYLTKSAEEITQTKDYTKLINIDSNDEIGRLSYAFNELLQETNSALESLKKENQLRLQRFIELIEIFNAIMQTKSVQACVEDSLARMKSLLKTQELYFSKTKSQSHSITLLVTDFETGEKKEYGYIVINAQNMMDMYEKEFYNSIANMISLQLDRIRLIDKTLSASHAKSSFISNMSHELRTPLNSIISATQYLISYEPLSDEQQDMVANVESSAQYLLEMINGILDIAKIEAGKMDVSYSDFCIVDVVEEIISMFMPLVEQKGLYLDFHLKSLQKKSIKSDVKLVKQVIINLLSNAIKFTHNGSIEITLSQKENSIIFLIKDSGIGIDKENIDKLFNDFVQLRNSQHKEYQGTGLGLSLSKKLANLLNGDIIIQSEGLTKGTEVTFLLKNQS